MELYENNFELYKIFYVTAECGSITEAARRLYLTQPSVTKHIKKLEEAMGCALFVRSKRGVTLTSEGRALLRHIEPACRLILSAEKEMRSLQSLQSGTVAIASTELSFKSYVLPAAERFMQRYPGVKLRFSNALNAQMIEMLLIGSLDIAILHAPFTLPEELETAPIEEMDEYLVCGRQFEEISRRENTLADLHALPFVSMPEGSSTKEYLRQCFAGAGLEFDPDIELTTVELTVQAVESGLGIGILPARIAIPRIEAGTIFRVPVDVILPKRTACMITNSRIPLSAAAQAFASIMLHEV